MTGLDLFSPSEGVKGRIAGLHPTAQEQQCSSREYRSSDTGFNVSPSYKDSKQVRNTLMKTNRRGK